MSEALQEQGERNRVFQGDVMGLKMKDVPDVPGAPGMLGASVVLGVPGVPGVPGVLFVIDELGVSGEHGRELSRGRGRHEACNAYGADGVLVDRLRAGSPLNDLGGGSAPTSIEIIFVPGKASTFAAPSLSH